MSYYTDIAAEIYSSPKKTIPKGVEIKNIVEGCVNITSVSITKSGLNRACGHYITLDMPLLQHGADKSEEHILTLAKQISMLLVHEGAVLVAGIGNAEVTADALGPLTVRKVLAGTSKASGLLTRNVYAVCPGVEGASGIKTQDYLMSLIARVAPVAVVCIDSLLTNNSARLGTSVQLATSGLAPNTQRELSLKTLGVPVIAIGVPTMMQIKSSESDELVVTPKNIDFVVRRASCLLASAINKALHPALSLSEIDFVTF